MSTPIEILLKLEGDDRQHVLNLSPAEIRTRLLARCETCYFGTVTTYNVECETGDYHPITYEKHDHYCSAWKPAEK